jgi:formaldehyde-activating enzyme involved in methanogenesis
MTSYILQNAAGSELARFTDALAMLSAARQHLRRGHTPIIMVVKPGAATQYRLIDFVQVLCRAPDFLPF